MSPIIRVLALVWPLMILAFVVVARLRNPELPNSGFLTALLTAIIPLSAAMVFVYLKRGGLIGPLVPQTNGVAIIVALLTVPAVGVGASLFLMFAFGL